MPKRISKRPKRPSDPNLLARQILLEVTGQQPPPTKAKVKIVKPEPAIDKATISAVMRALGAKGGKIGGKRRLETMTDEERSIRASEAANARWAKKRAKDD